MEYKSLQESVDEIACQSDDTTSTTTTEPNQLTVDFAGELSGYSEYTPIRMASRTVAYDADMERDNRRNRRA